VSDECVVWNQGEYSYCVCFVICDIAVYGVIRKMCLLRSMQLGTVSQSLPTSLPKSIKALLCWWLRVMFTETYVCFALMAYYLREKSLRKRVKKFGKFCREIRVYIVQVRKVIDNSSSSQFDVLCLLLFVLSQWSLLIIGYWSWQFTERGWQMSKNLSCSFRLFAFLSDSEGSRMTEKMIAVFLARQIVE